MNCQKNKLYIVFIILGFSFSYQIGDEVNIIDQNKIFEICYGHDLDLDGDGEIKLADFNGDLNGGNYHVMLIDMSATWCGPCYSLIPYFDDVLEVWSGYEHFIGIVALSDLNQPYSCTQWGNLGTSGIPLIIDDSGFPMFSMFNTDNLLPSTIYIDHNMKVHYKEAGYSDSFVTFANGLIEEMIYNMENSLIMSSTNTHMYFLNGDDDGIINPGETIQFTFEISNNSFNTNANNISMSMYDEGPYPLIWEENVGDIINLAPGEFTQVYATVTIPEGLEEILNTTIILTLTGDDYYEEFFHEVEVSLNQQNFPIHLSIPVKGSPAIVDIDSNGSKEIFVGDYLGIVHKYNSDGVEDSTGSFPFDTGDAIWGSLAAADIDLDGYPEVVANSKSKSLYVFDANGLDFSYDAESWLMGTPAIGQLDADPELEIVSGGYSSSGRKIYAVNHDGTNVPGFPVNVGEKMIVGVALHDFNNNGKDDIVIGTDSDNIHLMHDDGSIAWTYTGATDKIQSAPSIINTGNGFLICAGSNDDNMYCLDENGELVFIVETQGEVFTSPSAVSTDSGIGIFFGSQDGYIYGVDQNGNTLPGWPKDTGVSIIGSIAFSDLDNDGSPEVISTNDAGSMLVYHFDGTDVTYFPITGDFSYFSSPQILDFDGDNDLELFAGSTVGVEVFDIKTEGVDDGYWSTHRSNQSRTGYIEFSGSCTTADLNNDGIIDILDIVQTINIVMGTATPSPEQECAADINGDGIIDILDIVLMINIIIGG